MRDDMERVALTAALEMLDRRGVPLKVQYLLVNGDPCSGVPPDTLRDSIATAVSAIIKNTTCDHVWDLVGTNVLNNTVVLECRKCKKHMKSTREYYENEIVYPRRFKYIS